MIVDGLHGQRGLVCGREVQLRLQQLLGEGSRIVPAELTDNLVLNGMTDGNLAAGLVAGWRERPYGRGVDGLVAAVAAVDTDGDDRGAVAGVIDYGETGAHAFAVMRVNAALAAANPQLRVGDVVVFDNADPVAARNGGWLVGEEAIAAWMQRVAADSDAVIRGIEFDAELEPVVGLEERPTIGMAGMIGALPEAQRLADLNRRQQAALIELADLRNSYLQAVRILGSSDLSVDEVLRRLEDTGPDVLDAESRSSLIDRTRRYGYAVEAFRRLDVVSARHTTALVARVARTAEARRSALQAGVEVPDTQWRGKRMAAQADRSQRSGDFDQAQQLRSVVDAATRLRESTEQARILEKELAAGLKNPAVLPAGADIAGAVQGAGIGDGGAALRTLVDIYGYDAVDLVDYSGWEGLPDTVLQARARGRLLRVPGPKTLAETLTALGSKASALVVEVQPDGAIARYVVTNQDGVLVKVARHIGEVSEFDTDSDFRSPSYSARFDVTRMYAVVYDSVGTPVQPNDAANPVVPQSVSLPDLGQRHDDTRLMYLISLDRAEWLAEAEAAAARIGRPIDLSDPAVRARTVREFAETASLDEGDPRRRLWTALHRHQLLTEELDRLHGSNARRLRALLAWHRHRSDSLLQAAELDLAQGRVDDLADSAEIAEALAQAAALVAELDQEISEAVAYRREGPLRSLPSFCMPAAVMVIKALTGNPNIRLLERDGDGATGLELAVALGGRPRDFVDHDAVAQTLIESGPGSMIAVTDSLSGEIGGEDDGHTYVVVNDNGRLVVVDWNGVVVHDFPPQQQSKVLLTQGIVFDAAGQALDPMSEAERTMFQAFVLRFEEKRAVQRSVRHRIGQELAGLDMALGHDYTDAAGAAELLAQLRAAPGNREARQQIDRVQELVGEHLDLVRELDELRDELDQSIANFDAAQQAAHYRGGDLPVSAEALVRGVLDRAGLAHVSDMLATGSVDEARAQALVNRQLWADCSDTEKRVLRILHPEVIGAAEGIPWSVRDEVNRAELARLRAWADTTDQFDMLYELDALSAALRDAGDQAGRTPGQPTISVLSIPRPSDSRTRGRFVLGYGPEDATDLTGYVPRTARQQLSGISDASLEALRLFGVERESAASIAVLAVVRIDLDSAARARAPHSVDLVRFDGDDLAHRVVAMNAVWQAENAARDAPTRRDANSRQVELVGSADVLAAATADGRLAGAVQQIVPTETEPDDSDAERSLFGARAEITEAARAIAEADEQLIGNPTSRSAMSPGSGRSGTRRSGPRSSAPGRNRSRRPTASWAGTARPLCCGRWN